jgi:Holliday junction DNA helicase RuvA
MIGKLRGIVDTYGEDSVIVDVGGVGYLVHCSARTLQALPALGEAVTLAIETHVREDQIRLFGFLSDGEREWFRLLQTVQGVGTKVALAVLSTLKPGELATAIAMRDKAMVQRSPSASSPNSRIKRRPIRTSIRHSCACPASWRRSARRSR